MLFSITMQEFFCLIIMIIKVINKLVYFKILNILNNYHQKIRNFDKIKLLIKHKPISIFCNKKSFGIDLQRLSLQ